MPTAGAEFEENELRSRLRFEAFFADLASRLLEVPASEIPGEFECAVAGLADVLEVDRCGLAVFSPDRRALVLEHTFARAGVPDLRGADLAPIMPWWTEQIRRGLGISLSCLPDDLPPEAEGERRLVEQSGMVSHTVLPLVVDEEVLGALGAASFSRPRHWTPEFLERLQLLASVFAHALYRHRAEERISAAEALNEAILAALPNPIYVLDGAGRVVRTGEAVRRAAATGSVLPAMEGADYVETLARAIGDPRAAQSVREGIGAVLARRRSSFEADHTLWLDGGPVHRLIHAVPLGERQGTVVVHTDVTELECTRAELEATMREVDALRARLEAENVRLNQEVRHLHGFETIVGRSAALGRVLTQVEQVAPTDAPVLLVGETGTGKDLVAHAIHARSRRRERPMVGVNCAALPATIIESELFGYERGAFTGALQRSIGRFEIADQGTLFLDEIGELPLEVQGKLLRVLQSGEFERLGSPRTLRTDVRIIAATNRDLEREMHEGRFRADLYYRLSVFPVSLPPLRDRPEDIPLLVWHCIAARQSRLGRTIERVPERLMRAFTAYSWPGNVRELENVIERAMILSEGTTLAVDPVLFSAGRDESPTSGGGTLEEVERAHVRSVLVECGWKVAGPGNAADRLGLNRSTLQFRMKKLGIERPGPGKDAGA
jgi:transcriptional regulator with GAF, ATPase, and Fis domain